MCMFGYTVRVCFHSLFVCSQVLKLKSSLQIHVNPEALIFCPSNHFSQNGLLPQDRERNKKVGKSSLSQGLEMHATMLLLLLMQFAV